MQHQVKAVVPEGGAGNGRGRAQGGRSGNQGVMEIKGMECGKGRSIRVAHDDDRAQCYAFPGRYEA